MGDPVVEGLAVREWGDAAQAGILLWPGLGSSGAYFEPLVPALPWRSVAVDPPGSGGSAPLHPCTSERLVGLARDVIECHGCRAIVGHSLGGYVALGVAADPPPGVDAAVLIDGGFLTAADYVELGMPLTGGRAELLAWMKANAVHFPDWDTAFREVAVIIGSEVTPTVEAYVRDMLAEVDGEVRERAPRELMADLLIGVVDHDARARAERLVIPTLLIACGEPAERRATREQAWTRVAQASSLIDLRVVEGWRHNPILQDPERASTMIVDWLRAHL